MLEYRKTYEPVVVKEGKTGPFYYKVIWMCTHPTAYVGVAETDETRALFNVLSSLPRDHLDNVFYVHGGVTFLYTPHMSDYPIWMSEQDLDKIWIGWDYAHYGDCIVDIIPGKRWTLSEIMNDVNNALRTLEELNLKHPREIQELILEVGDGC